MNKITKAFVLGAAVIAISGIAAAQNPVIQTMFTPDPAPYVHGDTVYLFVDHDEDDAQYFKMKDWLLYTSEDMVNWTYKGAPISTATFKWAKQGDNAWASQAIERNGKWYWYICAEDINVGLHGVGVAVADKPEGPYVDPLGKPLIPGGFGYIDPSIFIDDDGQAYLFWGNNGAWYVPLKEDMITLDGEVREVPGLNDPEAFGPFRMKYDYQVRDTIQKTNYEEGPWVFKRNDTYYMAYAAGGVPEHMCYSSAPTIHGPWKYEGRIMGEADNSFTIHGGSIEFHGRNFMFYHNGILPNGGGFRRSTAIEEFEWTEDGKIPFIPFTKEGVKTPVRNLNPYQRVEAETIAFSYGLKNDRTAGTHHYIKSIHNGDWIKVRSVDFGARIPKNFSARVAGKAGGVMEVRADRLDGDLIAVLNVNPTASNDDWTVQNVNLNLKEFGGVHDIYILFRGGDEEMFHFDYWEFK